MLNVIGQMKTDATEVINPGDFRWQESGDTYIIFACPCGCNDRRCIPVTGSKAWQWDGNKEQPTLNPSIRYLDGCLWHGYLTAGIFITCSDSGAK